MARTARSALVAVVIFLLLLAGIDFATGRVPRGFRVVPERSSIRLAGAPQMSVQSFARRYQPIVQLDPGLPTPPLLAMHYEVVEEPDDYVATYYLDWADEVHPNPVLDVLYRAFRSLHYGIPTRDIEYFQITVNRASGGVDALRFETTARASYTSEEQEHFVARLTRDSDTEFRSRVATLAGAPVGTSTTVSPRFTDSRVHITPASWNHLTRLVMPHDHLTRTLPAVPLSYLTDAAFASGKYARKSQGDFMTSESPWVGRSVAIGALLYWIAAVGLIVRRVRKRRRPR